MMNFIVNERRYFHPKIVSLIYMYIKPRLNYISGNFFYGKICSLSLSAIRRRHLREKLRKVDLPHTVTLPILFNPYELVNLLLKVVEETMLILKEFGYTFEKRGLVSVKGKGQLLTFFVNNRDAVQSLPNQVSSF